MKDCRTAYSAFLCGFLLIFLFMQGCGRGSSDGGEGDIKLYFLDSEDMVLKTQYYDLKSEDMGERLKELLGCLKENRDDLRPAVPDTVSLLSYTLAGDVMSLYFDVSYANMDTITELFARAAIVLTLTQLEEVNGVNFYVNNSPLKDAGGNNVGSMTSSSFVDNVGKTIDSYENVAVTLYFANYSGSKLKAEVRNGMYDSSLSLERYIVEQIIKGPSGEGLYRTISQDAHINGISTYSGVCYIDLSGDFEKGAASVKDEIMVYSIVNSLTELPYISKVQLSIDGETDVTLHGRLSLEQPFVRDLSYMEE